MPTSGHFIRNANIANSVKAILFGPVNMPQLRATLRHLELHMTAVLTHPLAATLLKVFQFCSSIASHTAIVFSRTARIIVIVHGYTLRSPDPVIKVALMQIMHLKPA